MVIEYVLVWLFATKKPQWNFKYHYWKTSFSDLLDWGFTSNTLEWRIPFFLSAWYWSVKFL